MVDNTYFEKIMFSRFISINYQLIEKIGEGGFGQVFKAKQHNTQQFVAIKILTLNPEFDSEKRRRYIERFERETLLGSRLQHPNIVRLLDKGQCDSDLIYAVFEFIEGQTLKEKLAESGTLSPLETVEVMAQVLDALAHAHKQGVVHRDIKPANIMLTKIGAKIHAKILDFGIGALVQDVRQLGYKSITLTQENLGTPSYSAPEQLRGEPPTPKTDLYVWGLVFIECLTGRPAISGSNLASIFHQQLSPINVPLPAAIAGHPVAALLRRIVHKKVNERAASATNVYQELIQLNFSTLVGDIGFVRENSALLKTSAGEDETLINDSNCLYTGLIERKQITVLCLSISVKSTAQEIIDLEVIDALHRDQKAQSIDIAVSFGAFHIGTLGDTMLFYFGYPNVSDNDSRLCARSALDIVRSINKNNSLRQHTQGILAYAHIGMHTGFVTTYTDTIPEGETPNIAMELARIALPNQVLCSEITQKILESYLEFEPSPLRVMDVNSQNLPLYLLTGERQVEAFGFFRANQQHHELIGRETELAELVELLRRNNAKINKGKFVHVHGEAGIGKSRLVFELRNRAKKFSHFVAQCFPEYNHNALFPILNIIKYKFSLDTLSQEDAVKCLRGIVKEECDVEQNLGIALLCSWLNLPLPDDLSPVQESPDIQKQILFDVISSLLLYHGDGELNNRKLFIFEDMHWADPTSIEFIANFVNRKSFQKTQHVFISTSRQFLPEVLRDVSIKQIEILKLSNHKTTEFILTLFENKNVEKNVLDIIVKRTDGIPLFVEEMVNMLKNKDFVHRLNGVVSLTNPDNFNNIPFSLRDSLQQKLDDLTYAKKTAQLASVIGREFNYDLLVSSSNQNDEQLQVSINELLASELIYIQRKVDGDSYIFKHALVRDAAYESTPPQTLIMFHRGVAIALEQNFPNMVKQQPLVVANHYARANDYLKASHFGTLSIYDLMRNSFNQEALTLAENVSHWIECIDDNRLKQESTLLLNGAILPVKTMFLGWGHNDIKILAENNVILISQVRKFEYTKIPVEDLNRFEHKARWALFFYYHLQGQRKNARQLGEKLLGKALDEKNRVNELVVRTILAQAYFFDADFEKSKRCFSRVLEIYDDQLDRNLYLEYVVDPYLFSAGNLLCIESLMGNHDAARNYYKLCLKYAEATKNIGNIVTAYTFGTCMHFVLNDRSTMKADTMELLNRYGDKVKNTWVHKYFLFHHDWTSREFNRSAKTVEEEIKSGQDGFLSWYVPSLADTYIYHSMYDKAIAVLNNTLQRSISSGEKCILSISYRYLAIACYKKSEYLCEKSLNYFQQSISLAQEHNTKWLEFQASLEFLKRTSDQSIIKKLNKRLCQLVKEMNGVKHTSHVIELRRMDSETELTII